MADAPKSEFQTLLEESRDYFNGDDSKINSVSKIMMKFMPKIKEIVGTYFSDPEKTLKGIKSQEKAVEKVIPLIAEVIKDPAVTESTFEYSLTQKIKELFDKKVTEKPTVESPKKSRTSRRDDVLKALTAVHDAVSATADPDATTSAINAEISRDTSVNERSILSLLSYAKYDPRAFSAALEHMTDEQANQIFTFIRNKVIPATNTVLEKKPLADNVKKNDVRVGHDYVTNLNELQQMSDEVKAIREKDVNDRTPEENAVIEKAVALEKKLEEHPGKKSIDELSAKYFDMAKSMTQRYGYKVGDEDLLQFTTYSVLNTLKSASVLDVNFDSIVASDLAKNLYDNGIKPSKTEYSDPKKAEEAISKMTPFERGFHVNDFVNAFIGTIKKVAKKYGYSVKPYGIEYEDLVSVGGNIVLPRALAEFDASKGTKFNTFFFTALDNTFQNVLNSAKAQKRSPHSETESGEKVSAPGLVQSLETPVSQSGEEGKSLEEVLPEKEKEETEKVEEETHAVLAKAKEMVDYLIAQSSMRPSQAEKVRRLFDYIVSHGPGHKLTEFAKKEDVAAGTPTVWAGRLIYPALLYAFGKYGKDEAKAKEKAVADSKSMQGVHLQKFNLMKSDKYDENTKTTAHPIRFLQSVEPADAKEMIDQTVGELKDFDQRELPKILSQINNRIDMVNAEYDSKMPHVTNAEDLKKAIEAYPGTMFNIVNSIMDVHVEDVKRLSKMKFGKMEDVYNHMDAVILWLHDFLTGYNKADTEDTINMLSKDLDENEKRILKILVSGNFIKNEELLKKLHSVKTDDVELDRALMTLCEKAFSNRIGIKLELDNAAEKANDLYLELSPEEDAKFKSSVREMSNENERTALFDIINSDFNTDAFVDAAIKTGMSLHDITKFTTDVVIPMLGGKYEQESKEEEPEAEGGELGEEAAEMQRHLEQEESRTKDADAIEQIDVSPEDYEEYTGHEKE